MGLFSSFFDSTGSGKENCEIKVKLSAEEMYLWSFNYYRGRTSYKEYFSKVLLRNKSKLSPIMDAAKKKAEQRCDIDNVYVNFYYNQSNYIMIPFDDFSEKENMTISRRNNKTWNKDNIIRILKNYPKMRKFDNYVMKLKNQQDGIEPIPKPEPPKPEPIIQPKPKPISPSKPQSITLESNGKSMIIMQTQTIAREIIKSLFGNHKEIYNKQFDIIKDNSGEWFITGYDVPPTAKDAKGNVYNFHRTKYNGNDVTNKMVKIEDGGVIKVGNIKFIINFQ